MSGLPENALSEQQIICFVEALFAHCANLSALRQAYAEAAWIQFPKIPSRISENLAARILASQGKVYGINRLGFGGGADIVVHCADGATLNFEVKGSGSSEFQTIGPKDWQSDCLFWLRFGAVENVTAKSLINWTIFFNIRHVPVEFRKNRMTFSQMLSATEMANSRIVHGVSTIVEVIQPDD